MFIQDEDARAIEAECNLDHGVFASNRDANDFENLYFQVPVRPPLAFHVDYLSGKTALVLYEQNTGAPDKPHLAGAEHAGPLEASMDNQRQWAGLTVARQGGLKTILEEDLSAVLTGWVGTEPGQRFSWSIQPGTIRGIWQGAPRPLLMGPKFGPLPPVGEGGESPGMGIMSLSVDVVVVIHSIIYQGVSTLQSQDGQGLWDLAETMAAMREREREKKTRNS